MTSTTSTTPNYKATWGAWGILLAITLIMLNVHAPWIIMLGIGVKALIIMLDFMHLKFEHRDIIVTVILGIFITSAVMYGLMAWEARSL